MKIAVMLILLVSSVSFAGPRVCFVSKESANEKVMDSFEFETTDLDFESSGWSPPRCENIQRIRTTAQVLQITLGIGGISLFCTGAGIPATALVSSAILGIEIVRFVVDQIPCEDVEKDKKMQAEIRNLVCEQLNRSGYKCEYENQLRSP